VKTLNVVGVIVMAVTIIALVGIAIAAAAAASLLVQSASATTTTSGGGGEQETVSSTTTTTTTNNVSNALLGSLFSYGEGEDMETNVNPINETYIVVSYSGNRIILPPNATGVVINATEIGNLTINIQPNGLSINQGQAVIMTEDGAAEEGENATITFVLLSRTNPDGSGSGTSVTFFSTNSTGQLAFLDNMVAIGQVEYSPEEGINRFAEWEWKGGMLPFDTGVSSTTTTNNVSNALLGSLFLTGEDKLTSFNPINETYTEVSYAGNRTIMPPNATTATATINATETGNLTLNLQPNGITFVEGQSLLVTEGDSNNGAEQENATAVFVDLNGVRPDDPRSSTGVIFFSTNSTGQLAFLDNMVAIYQVKASPAGTAIEMWEWKGAELPFESGAAPPTTGNQTTITSALGEEEEQ
jgi:hypothetical protein